MRKRNAFAGSGLSGVLAVVLLTLALTASPIAAAALRGQDVNVGSKRFTESYILGEILTATINGAGEVRGVYKPGLGNTGIVFAALRSGSIDLYAEYTGTIANELLTDPGLKDLDALNRALRPMGLIAMAPLGFSNTYALAMREADARQRGIRKISDLASHPDLRLGLSQEFLQRKDGWPAVISAYGLDFSPRGLDHGLAYEALAAGQVDVIDMYSTDAKQVRYRLRVLVDDRAVFPDYQAVILARQDLQARAPKTWTALLALTGRLDAARMTALNAEAELEGKGFAAIADDFLTGRIQGAGSAAPPLGRFVAALLAPDLGRLIGQHLLLVGVSLALAVLVGIPLGIWSERAPRIGRGILATVAVVQTIPSLALLAFLIPVLASIGTAPALIALFLYSLLPIVRNTESGLRDLPFALRESAAALGLSSLERLKIIELPLASRAILAGIKTSAVLNVGTATIAAFIGAGGLGERIASGLALNDNVQLLAGAIPAAVLALTVQSVFDLLERHALSPGIRIATAGRRADPKA